ncbi:molybdenum ABC transporter ATP-binding protein [Isosphaeraceae bacterium EP7]
MSLDVRLTHPVHPGLTLDVSFTVGREPAILFGRSGAGKSTLLRLIAGLVRPDSGSIRLDGIDLFDSAKGINVPLRHRRIGLIHQDDLLFPHLSVASNIRFGLAGCRPRREARSRVAEVAELCGVEHLLGRRPETLSGGERQRVGLARALAPGPRLLLCDEPVSALDLPGRQAMIDRLAMIQKIEQIPLLHVTHSPSEAIALGSTLLLMSGGKIIDRGPPLDVLGKARDADANWHDARNVFRATVLEPRPGEGETIVRLEPGPDLVIPHVDSAPGTRLVLGVSGDDVLLAKGPIQGLSARNILRGRVDRILAHGHDAEVVVTCEGSTWLASVVAGAVTSLGLEPGVEVSLVIKARAIRVLDGG